MAINIAQELKARNELLSKSVRDIETRIELLPEGRLCVKHRKDQDYYYVADIERSERYLRFNEIKLIRELAQKDYLKRVLKAARQELNAIEKMQLLYPDKLAEDVYDQLPDARKKYVQPINLCDDTLARKWMETPYARKPFKKGSPEFYTLKGERVRSKSEVIIADRLAAKGIPYRYECPLMVGKEVYHPDFTILRMSDRKILYHEHCGKMDDPGYTEDMLVRANNYSEAGIIIGDRLFYTFESSTSPIDIKALDRLIDRHYR